MNKRGRFNQIIKDVKSIKIQGARNVAKAAIEAYSLFPNEQSKKILLSLRPTEPMLANVLDKIEKVPREELINHFEDAQKKINKFAFKIIKSKDRIFTHCHSTNVINALIYSKKHGKNFEVYNTETRPLFQGRKTALELKKAGIKTTLFIDSASLEAMEKENKLDKIYATKIFLGADALLKDGIINKIGSRMIADLAHEKNIPVYIIADSWKFSGKKVPIEQRKLNEIWNRAPKNIMMKNPSFEFVPKKYIKAIISEKGVLDYNQFIKKFI